MFSGRRNGGQTWSFDLLIAVVIFIVVVGIFYAFLSNDKDKTDPESLQDEAKSVSRLLNCDVSPSDFCIIQNGEIIESRLNALSAMTPEELADKGIVGSYCIYFEDSQGNIVPINGGQAGIGSPDFVWLASNTPVPSKI